MTKKKPIKLYGVSPLVEPLRIVADLEKCRAAVKAAWRLAGKSFRPLSYRRVKQARRRSLPGQPPLRKP